MMKALLISVPGKGKRGKSELGRAVHDINIQYSGVDCLLVYRMGRYHKIIP